MSQADAADVVIVGGGAAGLSAAGALTRLGVRPVVLDASDHIGATWERRYDRLRLHTVRRWSGLAHLPISRDHPRYLSKNEYAAYLRTYARTFNLDVRLSHHVHAVGRDGSGWRIATDRGDWRARVAILATGRHREPLVPAWPGRDAFQKRLIHSDDYRSGSAFIGQRVLVVGIGNSGAEIAVDLAEQGADHVAVSVRSRPPIVLRDLFGVLPAQSLGLAFTPIPASSLIDRVGAWVRRLGTGDLTPYGLGAEAWGPFTARRPAVIDVGFVRELKARRVHVRPDVERLTSDGVRFRGGREESFDAVIAATGYRTALEQVLQVTDAIAASGRPASASGRTTPWPGLYFIGYGETTRGVLFEANRDSRRLARAVARYLDDARSHVTDV
jgi:thioredoxin reductase